MSESMSAKECNSAMLGLRLETDSKIKDLWEKNDAQDKQLRRPSWATAWTLAALLSILCVSLSWCFELLKIILHLQTIAAR